MSASFPVACFALMTGLSVQALHAQTIQLGEVLVVHTPAVAPDADRGAFESHVMDSLLPRWDELGEGIESHLFRADRGKDQGSYWMVWSFDTRARREATRPENDGSGFSQSVLEQIGSSVQPATEYVSGEGGFTDYELIGADSIRSLPGVELLGVHYIQVREDRQAAFDAFVRDTLHPALVGQIPGMDLLYYKGVRGEHEGRYLTIFAIESVEAREQYWPTGSSETQALKDAFEPLGDIARRLRTYLVEDSYLKADTGAAAAIFESLEWTDFAFLK